MTTFTINWLLVVVSGLLWLSTARRLHAAARDAAALESLAARTARASLGRRARAVWPAAAEMAATRAAVNGGE